MAPSVERLQLPGPAGTLEALIETPQNAAAAAFGVICHPHPVYGGTLDNKVVYMLARTFQELGLPTIRFNFRGVGASEGAFDNGIGETDDVLAVIAHGRERWPRAALWLAGFSFGGAVAIRAAVTAKPARLVTVAPAINRVDLSGAMLPNCPWLIVQGDADELVNAHEVLEWARRLPHPPDVTVLPGVDHFFHRRLHELQNAVLAFADKPSLEKQKPG